MAAGEQESDSGSLAEEQAVDVAAGLVHIHRTDIMR
jgi:hypothetical protein